MHLDCKVRILPRCEAPQLGNASAVIHCFLQAASGFRYISQEAEGVEEIRLARGIGPGKKNPFPKTNVHGSEISPIFQDDVGDNHGFQLGSTKSHLVNIMAGVASRLFRPSVAGNIGCNLQAVYCTLYFQSGMTE